MREKLYSVLEESNDVTIYDSQSIDWSTFTFTNGYYKHKLTQYEIERPYLVSSQYYGTVDYEDIILLINNIEDIFEVAAGEEIKVPKLVDLRTFIKSNRK